MVRPVHIRKGLRRLLTAAFVALLAVTLLVAPQSPIADSAAPEAQAQTNQNWGYDVDRYPGCGYRSSTGQSAPYAQQLCWIDMSELASISKTPKTVTKDLGRYRITYDVSLTAGNPDSRYITVRNNQLSYNYSYGPFGQVAGTTSSRGVKATDDVFAPMANDATKPIVAAQFSAADIGRDAYKFSFKNIVVFDKATGTNIASPRLVVADAESTRPQIYGENFTVHESTTKASSSTKTPKARAYTRITPDGFIPACDNGSGRDSSNVFGQGVEDYYGDGDQVQKDFVCREYYGAETTNAGTYLVGVDGAKNLDIGLYSRNNYQAFALALDMSRMSGGFSADTTMEQAATGQATAFNFQMALRNGTTDTAVPWQGDGVYTQAIRTMNTADAAGTTASDTQVFSSTGTGSQADKVFDRYTPAWTCTVGSSTVNVGSGTSGYTVTNDRATGKSELVVANSTSAPIKCNVVWKPKFAPATLKLDKEVLGSAAQFSEISSAKFQLDYTCTDPGGFATAYPGVPLTSAQRASANGGVTVNQVSTGGSYTVTGLPLGASCTVSETEVPAVAGTDLRDGKDYSLNWSVGNGAPAPSATRAVTLSAGTNSVGADNKYDFRTATVRVNKSITGEAVSELGSPRNYRFSLTCIGSAGAGGSVNADPADPNGSQNTSANSQYAATRTLVASGSGDNLSGNVDFPSAPAARDCLLKPLSGLSDTESETINFDGREVRVNGTVIPAEADGSYKVHLPSTNGALLNVDIVARYSYKVSDVPVIKELSGPAADLVRNSNPQFRAHYECTSATDASYSKTGDLDITTDSQKPAVIGGVRVAASCKVFENNQQQPDTVTLTKTTVRSGDGASAVSLNNDEAKTSPVVKVKYTGAGASDVNTTNQVLVNNYYDNKLGTVTLNKIVDAGLITNTPGTFRLHFTCGTRSVATSNDRLESVDLSGTVDVDANGSATLAMSPSDSPLADKVNDQEGGALGVPYGNTCRFSEDTPRAPGGVVWTTDVSDRYVTVGSPAENVDVVNTFTAAGKGVTVQHHIGGIASFAQSVDYELVCDVRDADGGVQGSKTFSFTLSKPEETKTITAEELPEGSSCILREVQQDSGARTVDGKSFTVDRNSNVDITGATSDGGSDDEINIDFLHRAQIGASQEVAFNVGASSVIDVSHNYSYVQRAVGMTKSVQFDPATQQYISDARKAQKRGRDYNVQLACTAPDGVQMATVSGTIKDGAEGAITFPNIPDGATCTATELVTTTSPGVSVKQSLTADGDNASSADRTATFTLSKDVQVGVTNLFSRRLTEVTLNKIAHAPIDIEAAMPGVAKSDIYHTHNFTLLCRDPQTGDDFDTEVDLETQSSTITGPGTTTFANVPVGANCRIKGDQFGDLTLRRTDEEGDPLVTYLHPDHVTWTLDRTGGEDETFTDTELPDDTTTSQMFSTVDASDSNVVNLNNYYQFVYSKTKMSKEIRVSAADFELLKQAQPSVNFNYQCKGVGYSVSTIGAGDATLPRKLNASDFNFDSAQPNGDGSYTLKYTSPDAEIQKGAWCTFTETGVDNTPKELQHSFVAADGTETDAAAVVEKRVNPDGDNGQLSDDTVSYDFINKYSRRYVPVRLAPLESGYLNELLTNPTSPAYNYKVTCNVPIEGAEGGITKSYTVQQMDHTLTLADKTAPRTGDVVQLPVGAQCALDLNGSPALQARGELEVTNGDRRPYVGFASWIGDTPNANNSSVPMDQIPVSQVTDAMKSYTFDFEVPADLTQQPGTQAAMTVAGDAMHKRAEVDLTFKKLVNGKTGQNTTFTFTSSCAPGETFELKAGESATIDNVPVNSDCTVEETKGVDGVAPVVSFGDHGDLIEELSTDSSPASPENPTGSFYWNFRVKPVADASDLATNGSHWAMEGVNSMPGISVKKTIDGSPLSSISGPIADTALLTTDADSMTVHYVVTNEGARDLQKVTFAEPELLQLADESGNVTINGAPVKLDEDGTLPDSVCSVDALAQKAQTECTFTVDLPKDKTKTWTYKGTVTATAATESGGSVSASDTYGAVRLKESLAWLLPETGQQTLVLVLLLGLLALAFGLWRYLRGRDDEDDATEEAGSPEDEA